MRSASAGLINLLATSRQFFWCDCFDVQLAAQFGGAQSYFTSADQPLVFNSGSGNHTYSPGPPYFERSKAKWSIGLQVDTLDMTIKANPTDLLANVPVLQDLLIGKFDDAQILVSRVIMPTFGNVSNGGVVIFGGNVADISEIGRSHAKFSLQGFTQKLNHPLPRNVYQPSCRWTLFDAGCTLNPASFQMSGTVQASANNNVLNVVTALGQPNQYFALGSITFTSGQNSGLTRSIRSYDGTNVVLYLKLPFTPGTGDAFTILPGCSKTMGICSGTFNNLPNFGGEPFVPIAETSI